MIKVVFLGTNGWFDTDTGNTISILVDTSKFYIVLDAGNGIHKLSRYTTKAKPVYIFLSHFHLDHVAGLHTLLLNEFPKGLSIIVQENGRKILDTLVNLPFTMPLARLPFSTKVLEVPKNSMDLPFKAEFLPMTHSSLTLGVRLEIEGKTISYCPDTGYCKNAVKLAQNADLLVTECALRCGEVNPDWPHLNPEFAARIAVESGAKKLVLTHFDAKKYPDFKSRAEAEKVARGIFENSYASRDGMEIEV
jgi:ribonuclease BN (tRNA processing enzyme)